MRTGLSISTAAHLGLITLALTGLPFFGAPERQPVQVSEVSIMSEAEFDALRSSAPDTFALDQNLSNPTIDQASVEAPDADARPVATVKDDVEAPSAQDQAANMEDVRTRIENPDVQVAVAEPAPEAPSVFAPSTSGIDSTNALPNAPSSPARPPAPRPADIVASLPQPAPPSPANPAPLPREVTRSDQSEEKADQKEDEENSAQEEATTEISPEAPSGDENSPKLARAAPPRARPADFEEQVAEAEAEVERQQAEAEAAKADQEAEDVAAALAAIAQANEQDAQQSALNARPDVPVGPPISSGERDAFFSQIAACWTFDPGTQNAADLIVTVEFDLNPDGTVAGSPRLVEPQSGAGIDRAFAAASRAIRRCSIQNGGYDLPSEKYARWQKARITFDPSKRVLNW